MKPQLIHLSRYLREHPDEDLNTNNVARCRKCDKACVYVGPDKEIKLYNKTLTCDLCYDKALSEGIHHECTIEGCTNPTHTLRARICEEHRKLSEDNSHAKYRATHTKAPSNKPKKTKLQRDLDMASRAIELSKVRVYGQGDIEFKKIELDKQTAKLNEECRLANKSKE